LKRFALWLIAMGGGILAIGLSGVVAEVGNAHDARAPWLVIYLVSLSYCAIPALDAAAQLSTGMRGILILRRVVTIPLIITALTTLMPLALVVTDVSQMERPSLMGALIATVILAPFVWYYLSLYRRLGRALTGISRQTKGTAEIKST